MDMNEIFYRKMKAFRKLHRSSIEEFAEETGISKTYVQNVEKGKANPTLGTVQQIGENLGVPPVSLLMEEYSDDQFMVAYKLLETLDSFQKLDQERRKESVMLLDRLVRLLFQDREE